MIYLIPLPENRLDRRGRASGWRQVPVERDGKSKLRQLAGQLKDRGVTEVYASDLDKNAAECVAQELKATVRTEFSLRHFNFGHQHGCAFSRVAPILEGLASKWDINPDVPIRGGDSLSSFRKRFLKRASKLVDDLAPCVLLTDLMCARAVKNYDHHYWIHPDPKIQRGKIYVAREACMPPMQGSENGRRLLHDEKGQVLQTAV